MFNIIFLYKNAHNSGHLPRRTAGFELAYVASVSVVDFPPVRGNFSLFGGSKIGTSATLMEGAGLSGEGGGEALFFLHFFSARPNFRAFNASNPR